jgi:hypothetical protein
LSGPGLTKAPGSAGGSLLCNRLVQSLPSAELELLWYGSEACWDHDDSKPSRQHDWEDGVNRELYQRVCNAAANLDLDERDEEESRFSISVDESCFLSDVAEMLGEAATLEHLSPEEVKALKRTIGALKSMPNITPGIDVRVEIEHILGAGESHETRCCVVEINSEHLEVSSQYGNSLCSDTTQIDSFEWFPDGESERSGDSDDWLGLLSYILVTDPKFEINDNSDEGPAAQEIKSAPNNLIERFSVADAVSGAVDRYRMDRVLWQIWTEYQHDFEAGEMSEVQDLRAFTILWVATFMPEVVSVRLRLTLAREVLRYRDRPDYWSFCGMRTLPIEAALYSLTGAESWLDTIRFNLGHHKQSHRLIVTESLALVANQLAFDAEMLGQIDHNLEAAHSFSEWPVILFATSIGEPFWKRQQIQRWLDSHDVSGCDREVLEKLVRGEWIRNPFLNRLLRIQQFLTLRLACLLATSEPPAQLSLLSPDQEEPPVRTVSLGRADDQLELFDGSMDISTGVWKRLSEHPLTSSLIKIEGRSPT